MADDQDSSVGQKHLQGAASMRPQDQTLFNVGGLAWPRHKDSKRVRGFADACVSLMHMMHNLFAGHHDREVLRDEQHDSMRQRIPINPDGTIFGDRKIASNNGPIECREAVPEIKIEVCGKCIFKILS